MLLEEGEVGEEKDKSEGKEGALVFKGAPSLLGALCRIEGSNFDETTYTSILDALVDRQGDVNGRAVAREGDDGGKGGEKGGEGGEKKKSLGARVGARVTRSKLPKEEKGGEGGEGGGMALVNRGGDFVEFTCVQEAVVSGNLFCLQWLLKKGFFIFPCFSRDFCHNILIFDFLLPFFLFRCFLELARRNGNFSCDPWRPIRNPSIFARASGYLYQRTIPRICR